MDVLILAQRPDLVSPYKKKSLSNGITIQAGHRGKIKESKKMDKFFDFA